MNIVKRIKASYTYARYKYKRTHNCEYINNYFRNKLGVSIGHNCHIYSNITSPEAYLIHIGNNVTISSNVTFLNHDNSICKVLPEYTDVFGKIIIEDNCFIGANSTILPGVILGANTIVAAGSVVTKSFSGEVVIGGNPAKIISDTKTYKDKVIVNAINTNGLSYKEKKELLLQSDKLIRK